MTKIEVYNSSSHSSDGAAKGTSSNPYTQAEFEEMLIMEHGLAAM